MNDASIMPEKKSMRAQQPDVHAASDDYARRFAGSVGRYFLDRQWQIVQRLVQPWPGATVLDVGGGHAQLAVPLARHGFSVTVTGSHPDCRLQLERLLASSAYRFVECPLDNLPFPDRSFEIVVAFRLLAHVDDWRGFLAELCRVSRSVVIVDYAENRSINALADTLFAWKRRVEKNTRPYRCFDGNALEQVLAECDFTQTQSEPQFFFPMAAHRALRCGSLSRASERLAQALQLTHWFGSPVVLCATRPRSNEGNHPRGLGT